MQCNPTPLQGLLLLTPTVYTDARGHFFESFNAKTFKQVAGIQPEFVQTNESLSKRGVLRGLHWQTAPKAQGKLVRVVHGAVFDVAVDVRPESETFGQWVSVTLSAENFHQLYIPPGLAHGFCVLSDVAQFEYKCTDYYDPDGEVSIRWDDPDIAIDWPIKAPVLSAKDADGVSLAEGVELLSGVSA